MSISLFDLIKIFIWLLAFIFVYIRITKSDKDMKFEKISKGWIFLWMFFFVIFYLLNHWGLILSNFIGMIFLTTASVGLLVILSKVLGLISSQFKRWSSKEQKQKEDDLLFLIGAGFGAGLFFAVLFAWLIYKILIPLINSLLAYFD